MSAPEALVLLAVVLLVAGGCGLLALRALRASSARYWRLMAAVELTQKQLTELRSAQDGQSAKLDEVAERLAQRIEPKVEAIARHLSAGEAAAEVARSRAAGTLSEEAAERLIAELRQVGEESLAAKDPF